MRTQCARREAFTLVELLVVLAIIGLLVALLLPAVQAARDVARRAQCSNNMKQIGLAYHNHENVHRALPPAYISDVTKPAGWGVFLLPFLEQVQLYDNYSLDAPFYYMNLTQGIDNQAVSNTAIPVFRCPSAPQRESYTFTFAYPGYPSMSWQAWPSDYSPVAGVADSLNTYLSLGQPLDNLAGALKPDTGTSFAEFHDGTSNTILIAVSGGLGGDHSAGARGPVPS